MEAQHETGWTRDEKGAWRPPAGLGPHDHAEFVALAARATLLEAFAAQHNGIWTPGTSFPASPSNGQLFDQTSTDKLWRWDGTNWGLVGSVRRGDQAPATQYIDIQAGSTVVTTTAGGLFTITFPRSFVNVPFNIMCMEGQGVDASAQPGDPGTVGNWTAALFKGISLVPSTGGIRALAGTRVNWLAMANSA